jgi:integrase
MSTYFIKGKGWRYDLTHHGARYTGAWFKTKTEAKKAESKRKEEILNPKQEKEIPIVMGFLELVNRRLDHLKAYNSTSHYKDHIYRGTRWVREWKDRSSDEISTDEIQAFVLRRSKVSAFTANHELRCLRALFNFGIKRGWISTNPTQTISFLPVEKKIKYVPLKEDVLKVITAADPETQDYLWVIKETMGRMSEINRLTWSDVNFDERCATLYTRKKRGGHLTPRKVPMTQKLFGILSCRYLRRDKSKPWVFWHRYWDMKKKTWVEGPYQDRKKIMRSLCKKAGVKYFRYHPFRHLGASILDRANVNIGTIQRILGHENRTTTEIYLHSIGEAEREAMSIFEKAAQDSHTVSHTETKEELGQFTNSLI